MDTCTQSELAKHDCRARSLELEILTLAKVYLVCLWELFRPLGVGEREAGGKLGGGGGNGFRMRVCEYLTDVKHNSHVGEEQHTMYVQSASFGHNVCSMFRRWICVAF